MEVKNRVIELIDEELKAVHEEMKDLDRKYVEKQKRSRFLKKARQEIKAGIDLVMSQNV